MENSFASSIVPTIESSPAFSTAGLPSAPLQFYLFGPPQIVLHGQSLNLQLSIKAQALLYYLVVTQQTQARARLAALFWPDMPDAQARKNLRNILPELRRNLEDYLYIDNELVGVPKNPDVACDVHTLLSRLREYSVKQDPKLLLEAATLYQGDFLEGLFLDNAPFYEEWVNIQREHYRQFVIDSLYRAAQALLVQRNIEMGLQVTRRLVKIDRWHEAAHRLIMNFLWLDGQQDTAVNYYKRLKVLLHKELNVEPDIATEQLFEKIRSSATSLLQDFTVYPQPAPTQLATNGKAEKIAHNLPQYLTSFIGREHEIDAICTQLADEHCRLLTLFGEGGIGKTRLALAIAQAIVDSNARTSEAVSPLLTQALQFPDGVWFVSFGEVTATDELTEQLAATLAQALHLQFSGDQPLLAQLLALLHRKTLLLIIDNAEHLLPEIATFLVKILQGERGIKMVVTSRHLLNLQAEFVWQVRGLPIPTSKEAKELTEGELAAFSSISLFVERAKRVNRHFQLTTENQAEASAICQLVEGLPLAIELAAMLTKQYTCDEIYASLQKNYAVLATDLAVLPAKHRSIKTVLDYSWKFLNPEEARILAECSIFVGGFTFAAAAAIINAHETVLIKLADQSLLQLHEGRFTLHELIHQYASNQLAHFPEQQKIYSRRHALYYMELLHRLESSLLADFDAQFVIQNDLNNIRTAWHWSMAQGELTLLATGLESLECFYRLTCIYREAIHLLEQALIPVRLAVAEDSTNIQARRLQVHLLCHTAQFYRRSGEASSGKRLANEAFALAQQLEEPALLGLVYHELARLAQVHGDFTTMRTLATQGCTYARQSGLPNLIAENLNDLGVAVSSTIDHLTASPYFHEALLCVQNTTNRHLEARLIANLGYIHLFGHEYQSAVHYLQQALAQQRLLRDPSGIALTQVLLGDLWRKLGMYAEAQQAYEHAHLHFETINGTYWKSWLYASYGHLHMLRGDLTSTITFCKKTLQMAKQGQIKDHSQSAFIYLGHALNGLSKKGAARYCYQHAIDLQVSVTSAYHLPDAHASFAAFLLAQNELSAAMVHTEAALAMMMQTGFIRADEPFQVYWACVNVLRANEDPRAEDVLRKAYRSLQDIASKLDDILLRQSFLENVVVNRNLVAMAHAAGINS